MNITKSQRIAVFSLLAGALIITIGAFAAITQIASAHAIAIPGYVYLLITLPLAITIALVILLLVITRQRESMDEYREHTIELEEEQQQEEKSTQGSKGSQVDDEMAKAWVAKIMAQKNTFKELSAYTEHILSNIAKEMNLVQGIFFFRQPEDQHFHPVGLYAYFGEEPPEPFQEGETIPGQVAKNQQLLNLSDVPENYITILSGLGSNSPKHLLFLPLITNDQTIAIVELASFKAFTQQDEANLHALAQQLTNDLTQF
ncbi:MAG: GAF domain-containing protein [Bacteroidales bacterium]